MKLRLATAIALTFALSQVALPAMAETQTVSHFRSVERQSFSQTDLQRFGLSSEDAAQVGAYQQAGYQVQVVTPEEANQMTGGQFSNGQWLVIGIVALVIVVAVAVD